MSADQCDACQKRGQTWHGDAPKCAFSRGPWSSDNWNCATNGMLRGLFADARFGGAIPEGALYSHDDADQSIAMLPVRDHFEQEDGPACLWMTWYKDRGRTEQMWLIFEDDKPPRRPTEAEVVAIAKQYQTQAQPGFEIRRGSARCLT